MRKKDKFDVIEKRCATTAFDLHVRVTRDGRERGLWIGVRDDCSSRKEIYRSWLQGAIDRLFKHVEIADSQKILAEVLLQDGTENLLRTTVDDMGLLEWDDLQAVYDAIGKELKKRPRDQ